MTDPPATDLIAAERHAREEMARHSRAISEWAADRRQHLHDLHNQLGTWKKVAEATGQTLPAVTKAAYKQPHERNPQ